MSVEEWRPVPGFEGSYDVSDLGNVRSVTRLVNYSDGRRRIYPGKPCRIWLGPRRYLMVSMGRGKNYYVHLLVAVAFHGTRPQGLVACHGIGGAFDNRASNLRWDTARENNLDRGRHGTDSKRNQETCLRGHELGGRNLRVSPTALGLRECRACASGRSSIKRHPDRDLQTESDRYFSEYSRA